MARSLRAAVKLQLRKHSIYDRIDKQTRSTCYKLMDRIDEIDDWYKTLDGNDQLRWKHPDSIAKTPANQKPPPNKPQDRNHYPDPLPAV